MSIMGMNDNIMPTMNIMGMSMIDERCCEDELMCG